MGSDLRGSAALTQSAAMRESCLVDVREGSRGLRNLKE